MSQPRPASASRREHGLSQIECLVVVAVTTVSLGAGIPGFDQARQRRELDATAAQLATDIQLGRSLAVTQNRPVRMSFFAADAGTCYVLHTGPANACRCDARGAACSAPARLLRDVIQPKGGSLQVRANVGSMLFDSDLGTVTPSATLRVSGAAGAEVRHVVSIMGRVRSCTPSGLPGLRPC